MIGVVLAALAIADVILIVAFLSLQRRQAVSHNLVRELTEERALLADLRNSVRAELAEAQSHARSIKDQIQVLATEAEQEVKRGVQQIAHEADAIVVNISNKLDAPFQELTNRQHFLLKLAKDAEVQRELLARVVGRAENAAKLLRAAENWEDVVDELESRRYHDIRAMLSKGLSTEKIAKELGVTENEVRLVTGTI
jgi:DNA-binding NarL/FixJ family response regulator